jgi:hypothetical protein
VRPTLQLRDNVKVNDEAGLEREADVMGARALLSAPSPSRATPLKRLPQARATGPVQGLFDNWRYPDRKMGAEVTEATAGSNRLEQATALPALGGLAPHVRNALWVTVNLPDAAGAAHTWYVAPEATVNAYFNYAWDKSNWMRWGDVSMTEDHGEFEWIIHHPTAPQNMGYYRSSLNRMNRSRRAMRRALSPVGADLVVAMNANPAAGQAFHIQLGATNAASAQITFESTTAATTKKALYEGVSHGLNKRTRPAQTALADVTPDIVAAAQLSATRFVLAGVDKELLMAYLYGDLIHKMATLIDAVGWPNAAGNFKNWRNLFPKSKPYQVTLQAFGATPTAVDLGNLAVALNGAQANIVQDIVQLFAAKLTSTGRAIYSPPHFVGGNDPGGHVASAAVAATPHPGGAAAMELALSNFFVANGLNLNTEYDNVRDGFTTPGAVFVPQVVRSSDTGFAQHAPGTSGFATEDRGEVQTTFPNLNSVYDRIKTLARRF